MQVFECRICIWVTFVNKSALNAEGVMFGNLAGVPRHKAGNPYPARHPSPNWDGWGSLTPEAAISIKV
jgi:hypothetical protein